MMQRAQQTSQQGFSRKRIEQLAAHKQSKQDPLTSFESSQLRWGDKDSMWIVSEASKKVVPSKRTQQLSQFKRDFKDHTNEVHLYTYSCGRSSPLQNIKKGGVRKGATKQRLNKLAEPKRLPKINQTNSNGSEMWTYSCGRESPIWHVRRPTKDRPSEADQRLALPKINHKDFVMNRELRKDGRLPQQWFKKFLAKGDSICTERLDSLAEAKKHKGSETNYIDCRQPEKCIRPVNRAATKAVSSDRVEELAMPHEKRYAGYVPDQFEWPVSRSALRYSASNRTKQLAVAVVRPSMEHTQYDPDAFFVKTAAKKAKCSQRLEQMAIPIQR